MKEAKDANSLSQVSKLTRVKLQLNLCPSKSTTPVLKRIHFQYLKVNLQSLTFQDTLTNGQTMICNNNYLADIIRVCEIKDLIWVMRFQSPLVYVRQKVTLLRSYSLTKRMDGLFKYIGNHACSLVR